MLFGKDERSITRFVSITTILLLIGVSLLSIFSPMANTSNEEIHLETHDRNKVDTSQACIIRESGTRSNNTAPVSNAGSDQRVKLNETVFFNGSNSYDPDNDNLSYIWTFGDGNLSGWQNSSQTSHSYGVTLLLGNYNATGGMNGGTHKGETTYKSHTLLINRQVIFDGKITVKGNLIINGSLLVFGTLNVTGSTSLTPNGTLVYAVNLTVSDGMLTSMDTCRIIISSTGINHAPVVNAGSDQNVIVNQTVNFDSSGSYDPDGDTLSYKWDFGDSTTTGWVSSYRTSHSYKNPGNYTVILTISDGSLTDNDSCLIRVTGTGSSNAPPVANAGQDQNTTVKIIVNFDGSGSYDPDGDNLTYKWDFGDNTSTSWLFSSKTSHSYDSPGNYTVTLTVSDSLLTDIDTCKIKVSGLGSNNSAPVADAGPDQYVNVNQTVNLDGSRSYDPDADTLLYKWNFGDNTSTGWLSSNKVSHSFNSLRNYTVGLTVSDGLLTDWDSCVISVIGSGGNNSAPVANAGPDQNAKVNQTINFDGSKSYDPDVDNLTYKWDFGDSTSIGWLTSAKTSHSYYTPGIYTVTLTVSDGLLINTDTCKISVSRTGNNNNSAPIAVAGPDQYVKVNQTVNFDGSKSFDPDADNLAYKWDFGDNTSIGWLTFSKTSHSYSRPGNYTVTLTVSDGLLIDTDTCKISVSGTGNNNNSAPVAKCGPNQYVKVNQTVNLDGSKSYDPDGDTLSYKWDFGDNTSTGLLSSAKTSHLYNIPGNYIVTLTVSDGSLTDTDSCIIYVTPRQQQQQNSSLPKIKSSNIQQNSQNIQINHSIIEIDFSTSMNRSSVESALSITPGINYTILWGNNDSKLQIIFNENLWYNTSYKISIGTNAKDLEENYLKDIFALDFTTEIEYQDGEIIDTSDEPLNEMNLLENLNLLWIITLLICIIIIILTLVIKNKRKKQEKNEDDAKEPIGRHEFSGGNLAEDFYFDNEFTKYSNELIKGLKKESLSLKKPSDFKLSNDEMLDKLNKQYRAGQLSKTAYNSVKDTLIEHDN